MAVATANIINERTGNLLNGDRVELTQPGGEGYQASGYSWDGHATLAKKPAFVKAGRLGN
jgi:hypothetical protein